MIVEQVLTKVATEDKMGTQTTSVNGGAHTVDTRRCKAMKRPLNSSIKAMPEGKRSEELWRGSDSSVLSELEKVVEKVETAVRELPSTEKDKKIKKSISMAAVEVRDFTKLLEENTQVEGMILTDDKAVVVLCSDSSEGSEGGGRNIKTGGAAEWERATTVSSRLRGRLLPSRGGRRRSWKSHSGGGSSVSRRGK